MRIDLTKDLARVSQYIQQRAKDYPEYINAGPGKDEDPIRMITLGYQFDQAGWIALVFDTRPNAGCDGEWQGYIEENAEPFDDWFQASTLNITRHDGKQRKFKGDSARLLRSRYNDYPKPYNGEPTN